LVLLLPDGSRSYIPAAWTDLASPGTSPPARKISLVAFLPDLWRTRQRVNALRRRIGTLPMDTTSSTQERQHASKSTGTMVRGTTFDPAHLSTTQHRATDSPHLSFGLPDAQAGPPAGDSETSFHSRQNL
jgi:hypothetical protein